MSEMALHDRLVRLHALLLQERECAKALDMTGLQAICQEKEELLRALQEAQSLAPADRQLAETIQQENRRNAYLFWAAFNWVRDLVGFLNRQMSSETYAATGGTILFQHGGRLLSGRI